MQISTPEVTVKPGARVTVTLPVPLEHLPWKSESLYFPPEVARSFVVEAIRVGDAEQFNPRIPVPAHAFAYAATPVKDLADPYHPLQITVINITSEPKTFRCDVFGHHDARAAVADHL